MLYNGRMDWGGGGGGRLQNDTKTSDQVFETKAGLSKQGVCNKSEDQKEIRLQKEIMFTSQPPTRGEAGNKGHGTKSTASYPHNTHIGLHVHHPLLSQKKQPFL